MAGKRYRARCINACFFQKQYWNVGKEYTGMKKPPADLFEIVEDGENDATGGDK